MTDEDLAHELCPDDPALGAHLVATMSPARRQATEGLIALADEINLWQAGLAPKPAGAIICGPRQVRGAGGRPGS